MEACYSCPSAKTWETCPPMKGDEVFRELAAIEVEEGRKFVIAGGLIAVETKKALEVPAGFNAEAFFSNYFGIIVGNGREPSEVDIRVDAAQVKYVKTLPLHASQTIVEETPEYTVFRYHLVPTFDFRREILSRGAAFEVLAPQWFRNEIGKEVALMCRNYGR